MPFLIMAEAKRVRVKEPLQAALMLFPPARMAGRVSVSPRQGQSIKLVLRGGYIIELLRILTEDAVWVRLGPAACPPLSLVLGSALYVS